MLVEASRARKWNWRQEINAATYHCSSKGIQGSNAILILLDDSCQFTVVKPLSRAYGQLTTDSTQIMSLAEPEPQNHASHLEACIGRSIGFAGVLLHASGTKAGATRGLWRVPKRFHEPLMSNCSYRPLSSTIWAPTRPDKIPMASTSGRRELLKLSLARNKPQARLS